MSDTVKDAPSSQVDLPLADPGKAAATVAPTSHQRPALFFRLRLWRLPLVMAVLFTGAVVGLYFQPPALRAFFGVTGLTPGGGSGRPIAVPAPAQATPLPVIAPTQVAALGRLLPEGDTVTLALPFGAGDARVARLLVAEGDRVVAGQVIAELDSLPQLAAQRASARAALEARQAALVQTQASMAANLTEATANRDRAIAGATLAASELARIRDLAARGVAAASQLDQAQAAATEAARAVDQAEAALGRYAGIETGTQADILLAERNLDVAHADLDRAEQDMAKGQVLAATAGIVLKLHVRAGEKPGADGVATLGNTDHMTAELEVYQSDIRTVAPGQSVQLTADALGPDPLTGRVARIGLEVERQNLIAADPAANTDARVIRVTVTLDPAASARAAGFTGLEVLGRISVGAAP
jgi:HlyD family secretion protein